MPKIIGQAVRVVEHDGLTIDEVAGNVSTNCDTLSIAVVKVSKPASEPWLTLAYDEWICVTKGRLEMHHGEGEILHVKEGETCFIEAGERFRPVFPVGDTEYIPVCYPAFRPDRCLREEEKVSDVSAKLNELHATNKMEREKKIDRSQFEGYEVLYHMCQKSQWEAAIADKMAYFPPTFEQDGMFTHATAVPQRLVTTANHFYTASLGDWICLELSRKALFTLGIDTVFEEAKPVGSKETRNEWDTWVCPHIYGGLPTHIKGIVTNVYDMKREADGSFVSIVGLTDQ
jgi:uncharacterized protein (DUF952 family)/mannose-6-phosphate isomerase-like protein (cupin superfamily)